jgi:nucleoside-triphosphatase
MEERTKSGNEGRPHMLLITGVPGIGKTTVIRRVADALAGKRIGGFYTEEIRKGGERQGFRVVSFDGEERVIAHLDFAKRHRVGKYGVDVAAIDAAASLLSPDPSAQLYLVDEIGRMECLSDRFITAMRELLAGRRPVVATIGLRGEGFISEVKGMEQCLLWEVNRGNRDVLPARILEWLSLEGLQYWGRLSS